MISYTVNYNDTHVCVKKIQKKWTNEKIHIKLPYIEEDNHGTD
jgi:hypothetical protein